MVGTTCCVPYCYNNSTIHKKQFSFHSFPINPTLKRQWINAINRQGSSGKYSLFNPKYHHRICGAHFNKSGHKGYLDHVPTIFPKPEDKPEKVRVRTERIFKETSNSREETTDENNNESSDNLNNEEDSDTQQAINDDEKLRQTEEKLRATEEELRGFKARCESAELEVKLLRMKLAESIGEKVQLHEDLAVTNRKLNDVTVELSECKKLITNQVFCIENVKGDKKQLKFYTGFSDYAAFQALFFFLEEDLLNLRYVGYQPRDDDKSKKGTVRSLSHENELFLVLCRLRVGLLGKDLAFRFNISASTVSRIFSTWIDFLFNRLSQIPIWLPLATIQAQMPKCFIDLYPNTRVIIDCTELFIEAPSCFRVQSQTYSSYKHHNTAKGLIGIAPNGFITFISTLAPGRLNDKKITKRSGIINVLSEGDEVMADRGFDIDELLAEKKVQLNIPPFLRGRNQLSESDEVQTRKIASVRIHVEMVIERVKKFRIIKFTFPISMAHDLDKIWVVCCHLTNFTNKNIVS